MDLYSTDHLLFTFLLAPVGRIIDLPCCIVCDFFVKLGYCRCHTAICTVFMVDYLNIVLHKSFVDN